MCVLTQTQCCQHTALPLLDDHHRTIEQQQQNNNYLLSYLPFYVSPLLFPKPYITLNHAFALK